MEERMIHLMQTNTHVSKFRRIWAASAAVLLLVAMLVACKRGETPTPTFTLSDTRTTTSTVVQIPTQLPTQTTSPLSDFRIVFLRSIGENSDIFVMNDDGSGVTNLTNHPTRYESPRWSPDGRKISFTAALEENIDIYVMDADGSGETNLSNKPGYNYSNTWSPDGKKIAFVSESGGGPEIFVVGADGSGLANLTNDPRNDWLPGWSPDGKEIAFVSSRVGNHEIYMMSADGTGLIRLGDKSAYSYAWSPVEMKIAFVSDEGDIYLANSDGSGMTNLTSKTSYYSSPAWSPDGKRIAFFSNRDGPVEIYVMNADGNNVARLTNFSAEKRNLTWSPDGLKIAFISNPQNNNDIFIMNADGSGLTNLTRSPYQELEFDFGSMNKVPLISEATETPVVIDKPEKCPGAPEITLHIGDWAMVSTDPPLPNKVRNQPGSSGKLIGQVQPGENVHVVDGPRCADDFTWWYVRSLGRLEGWTVEGDNEGYWLVDPIAAWYQLPEPLGARGLSKYDLRELSISADTALVNGITGDFFPLATPLPTPMTVATPYPDDPRGNMEAHAAHSSYRISGIIDGNINVYTLEDPLNRYFLDGMSYDDCTKALREVLKTAEITPALLDPFCGVGIGIPLHFVAGVKPIQFSGGKGVRFLLSSGNYQTVNQLYYVFLGLSDDGRFFIRSQFSGITHPYIVDPQLMQTGFGPLLAWKDGQYDEAQKSYDRFNARVKTLLNAGAVTLYPSLDFLDYMMTSIVIK